MGERISAYLQKRLNELGWVSEDLAVRGGLRVETVRSIVYGRRSNPTLETISGLAKGLGMTTSELLAEMEREAQPVGSSEGVEHLVRDNVKHFDYGTITNPLTSHSWGRGERDSVGELVGAGAGG